MRIISLLAMVGLLIGCASKSEVEALEARLNSIEEKIDKLATGSPGKAVPDADEKAAAAIYGEINKLMSADDYDGAKAKLKELNTKYPKSRSAARAKRLGAELEVVGKSTASMAGNAWAESWFVGDSADVDLTSGVDLVVFWEVWCPHCKKEVPKLQKMSEQYKGKMEIVGLTRLTRKKTVEEVAKFIAENDLTYPIAHEDGSVAEYFAVSGIPAAALVKDGTIVWRGHPSRLSEATIEKYIN
jgi:thiol-disulfide isomerase/thioredoxin